MNINHMKIRTITNAEIGTLIVVVLCVFPITQIILLQLNGGLSYLISLLFYAKHKSGNVEIVGLILNGVLFVIGTVGYLTSRKTWIQIISSFLIMLSGLFLMMLVVELYIREGNYLIYLITIDVPPLLVIFSIWFWKVRKSFVN